MLEILQKLKQNLSISSFFLIFLVSFIFLNEYSVKCTGDGPVKQYLEIWKITHEKWSLENVTEYNPWESEYQSTPVPLADRTPVQKDMNISSLFLYRFISNLSLIDLPPPAPHI